jgi:hypothetical protein
MIESSELKPETGGIEIRTKVVNSQSPTSKPLYQLEMEEERFPLLQKQISILLFR